jgi:hypothetical protein
MLIQAKIKSLCDAGILSLIPQSWPGLPKMRAMYASKLIGDLIMGPWSDQQEEKRAFELRAEIDWFIDGKRLFLRPDHEVGTSAWLARLDPPSEEVWEIRSIKPKPSLCILGTFAQRDVFVALIWAKRTSLGAGDSKEWEELIEQFKQEWHNYFSEFSPFTGHYPDDYISNAKLI